MTISFTSGGPTDTLEKLYAQQWSADLARLSATGFADGSALTLDTPYQVDYLSLDKVAKGAPGDAAQVTRWRQLIIGGGRPLAEVELNDHGNPIALHEGPAKDGLQAAIAKAALLDGDFTARVVQSAALKFSALKLQQGSQTLFIPYPPNQTGLANYEVIPAADAFAALQLLAAQTLKAAQGDGTTGG
ncbi:hypothetical protein [Sphingomonas sp. 28-62-11]|uniref:hypothetical protein n=1 Tax=Sphingomonas sp. 28-62-11 TaxID=1970432 RepID=UPI000BC45971|nr:MAG: hypothetical protein B7Y49_07505 [Sphingomonas sp. 28-62-11]